MVYGRTGIAQYQQVGTQSANYADPYELTGMLFKGALDRIAQARHAMVQQNVPVKGERISKAIGIVEGLRSTLDHEVGGELSANLESLYAYVQQRLLEANLRDDVAALDDAARLMRTVKEGWDAIPTEHRGARHMGNAGSGNGTVG